KTLRRCFDCDGIYEQERSQLSESAASCCKRCLSRDVADEVPESRSKRLVDARIVHSGPEGLDIVAHGNRHRLAWSLLQPLPKPAVGLQEARAKWRFHCVDLGDQPSDFYSGPDNRWEVEMTYANSCSSSSTSSGLRWRTGHLDVAVMLPNNGCCQVQLQIPGAELAQVPQLLCLGPKVHLCLEHRAEPLKAFQRSEPMGGSGEVQWPADVRSWRSVQEYALSWRRLSFMEAATSVVVENDGRLLGGVSLRFTAEQLPTLNVVGTFDVPSDLIEAHQLRIRGDDLLCIRWQPDAATAARAAASAAMSPFCGSREELTAVAFRSLVGGPGGASRLGSVELRCLADFTGFHGDDEEWGMEYLSLCEAVGCEEETGLDLAAFVQLVDDSSEEGCYCTDEELQELICQRRASLPAKQAKLPVDKGESQPSWVAHATMESADKFGDSLQVRFRITESEGAGIMPKCLLGPEPVPGFSIELLWLPETYHYQASALADMATSGQLVRDLILLGGIRDSYPVYGDDPESSGAVKRSSTRDLSHFKLNDSQAEAVRSALQSPATLIHGPPGTGKTRTAAVVALAFASQNAQNSARGCVLYSANSNRAVDVAAEAIMELGTERLEDLFEAQAAQ
ncbi:unnamed protein product, partial [Polarella glacialis]